MKHSFHTSIEIAANPQIVWDILLDLDLYHVWNPFITLVKGVATVGEKIEIHLSPPKGKPMTFKPTITDVTEPSVFEWLGNLLVPGLFDGRHRFELKASETGTTFVHSEQFSGLLVRFLRRSLDENSLPGFELMNKALKSRAESEVGQSGS